VPTSSGASSLQRTRCHEPAGRRQAAGTTRQDAGSALAVYDRLVEAGRDGSSFAEAARLIDSAGNPSAFAGYWAGMDERLWTFVRRKQDHDPVPDALRLHCPHLAVFGGADQLVPVADSIRLFSDAACHPDRHDRATLTVAGGSCRQLAGK